MVFCYKILTESPGRSRTASPRKPSPLGRLSNMASSASQLVGTVEYDTYNSDLLEIPERDWKLLAALARKRHEDQEREILAQQFQVMWQREREVRQMVEAETSEQYKRYLKEKRDEERTWREHRRQERDLDEGIRRGQLISCIKHKEKRSADVLAFRDDQKATELLGRAMEEEARALVAADRRWRLGAGEDWRRRLHQLYADRRAQDASRRKDELLRDAARRVAISNALSSWESTLLRQEVEAQETWRRARAAAAAAARDARGVRLRRARDVRRARATRLAALTASMREAIRDGRY